MRATRQLVDLAHRPDAIFVVNDSAAFGAMLLLKERKFRIPDDIALVGFTNEPVAALTSPSLSSVSQPTYEIGEVAAQLFLERISAGTDHFVPTTKVLKTQLVVRESSRRATR